MRSGVPEADSDFEYLENGAGIHARGMEGARGKGRGVIAPLPLTPRPFLHLYYVHEFLNRRGGLIERRLLVGLELNLDDLLDAFRAKLHRHAEELPPHAVLPFEVNRTG